MHNVATRSHPARVGVNHCLPLSARDAFHATHAAAAYMTWPYSWLNCWYLASSCLADGLVAASASWMSWTVTGPTCSQEAWIGPCMPWHASRPSLYAVLAATHVEMLQHIALAALVSAFAACSLLCFSIAILVALSSTHLRMCACWLASLLLPLLLLVLRQRHACHEPPHRPHGRLLGQEVDV